MRYYLEELPAIFEELRTDAGGLSEGEAERRLAESGPNKLDEGKRKTLFRRFLEQLADPMIIVLIAAAAISAVTAFASGESFADVFIILFVVALNAVLGVIQESKAEKAIDALKDMTAATSKVLRDGELKQIRSEELVAGDVILLEAGDSVPADARLIECAGLRAEEAALTGESAPVDKRAEALQSGTAKDIPLGDRRNMVYTGSTVVYGRGRAVVTATGMRTEIGRIADAISQAKEGRTPLQLRLAALSRTLTWLVLGVCVFMFLFSLGRSWLSGDGITLRTVLDTFMLAVSLAVAAIPEGLAAVVTIVLSIGVTKMSKRSAVIRKLTAVETLGCTQVICSDKTGTLTQNKMTVVEHIGDERLLATAMTLCSDAAPDKNGNAVGEPTECALVNFATGAGMLKPELEARLPRIGEAPFDSMRKLMSTVHRDGEGAVQFTKGAPDELLRRCTRYIKDGMELPLDEKTRSEILEANGSFAKKALRVLGAACRRWDEPPTDTSPQNLERELTFIGLCGMIDPVRPEVKDAVAECARAGIRPIMITGDHRDTAAAIARELGIITDDSQVITGAQLDEIPDDELAEDIVKYSVYARVQPEHKVRIVNGWKARGAVTAMTGDGVNDAPSIKSADIGVGMGVTGTDVTKNVADMVLADDNFATIVSAVEEGRRIYDNIRRTIQFLLSSNLSEVMGVFAATLMGFTLLTPVQLLWINLITDCFPALALGMEKGENDIMKRAPRPSKEGIFSGGVGADVVYQGIAVTLLTLAAYFIGHRIEAGRWEIVRSADGMTMAFLTMSMAEIFHSCNMRSQRGSIFTLKSVNPWLLGAMGLSLILTVAVIYVPFLAQLFGFRSISLLEYSVAMGLAACIIPIVELVKLIRRRVMRRRS